MKYKQNKTNVGWRIGSEIFFSTIPLRSRKRKTSNALFLKTFEVLSCGLDGTRTRDPMRDRHVF